MEGVGEERDGEKKSALPQTFKSGWGKAQIGSRLSCFDGKGAFAQTPSYVDITQIFKKSENRKGN